MKPDVVGKSAIYASEILV